MGTIRTDEYKGYTIELGYELDPSNPLDWMNPEERGAWFVMSHKRYDLPNELNVDFDEYDNWPDLAKAVANGKPYKFVNWYEHSMIAVSLCDDPTPSDYWDAGIVGLIVGNSDADIEAAFGNWKQYIEGDVYQISVTSPQGDSEYLGDIYGYDYAIEEAKSMVDDMIANDKPQYHAVSAQQLHS